MTRDRIELRIDELALEGFDRVDPARLGAAVRAELARLLAEGGVPAAWRRGGGRERLDGGDVRVGPDARPEVLGAHVARAVFGAGDAGDAP